VGFYALFSGRIRLGRNGRFWPKAVIENAEIKR